MKYKKRFEESTKMSILEAEQKAINGSVFICVDARNKDFAFEKLEDIPYQETTLGDQIQELQEENEKLQKEVENLKNTVIKLAEYIDSKRFLA